MSNTNNYRFLRISYNKDELYQMALNSSSIEWEYIEHNYYIGKLQDKTLVNKVLDQLPTEFAKSCTVMFFKNPPQVPHIDRTRKSAINFPLNVNASFFVAREYPSKWFDENTKYKDPIAANVISSEKNEHITVFSRVKDNEEHYYIRNSTTHPYLLNVKVPHGGLRSTHDTDRYIMTISSQLDFNVMTELCSDITIDNGTLKDFRKIKNNSKKIVDGDRVDHINWVAKYTVNADIVPDGVVMEFGVATGTTLKVLESNFTTSKIYGFDWWQGLPEAWDVDLTKYAEGSFSTNGVLPTVSVNTTLVKGLFEGSLPPWTIKHKNKKIALLHVDCDLYHGATTIFNCLNDNIVDGTVIVFDELGEWARDDYHKLLNHEYKALQEWAKKYNRTWVPLSRNNRFQAAIIVTN